MNLLVDNQLPVALARYLAAQGWECTHVQDVGLEAADDRTIWLYVLDAFSKILPALRDMLAAGDAVVEIR